MALGIRPSSHSSRNGYSVAKLCHDGSREGIAIILSTQITISRGMVTVSEQTHSGEQGHPDRCRFLYESFTVRVNSRTQPAIVEVISQQEKRLVVIGVLVHFHMPTTVRKSGSV